MAKTSVGRPIIIITFHLPSKDNLIEVYITEILDDSVEFFYYKKIQKKKKKKHIWNFGAKIFCNQ